MQTQIKIGADPELFLSEGNKFVSAHGLFPGTKEAPYRVDKGAVQVDGLALEFNIDPANTKEEFLTNIDVVLTQMREMVRKVSPDLRLNFLPVARFDEEEFINYPDECKLLGCDPDFNITGNANHAPENLIYEPIRTGSGHIHIGFREGGDPFSPENFYESLLVARHFHGDNKFPFKLTAEEMERLKFYGANGAFRPKPYGVELRSFSNVWVEHQKTREQMYDYIIARMNEHSFS